MVHTYSVSRVAGLEVRSGGCRACTVAVNSSPNAASRILQVLCGGLSSRFCVGLVEGLLRPSLAAWGRAALLCDFQGRDRLGAKI